MAYLNRKLTAPRVSLSRFIPRVSRLTGIEQLERLELIGLVGALSRSRSFSTATSDAMSHTSLAPDLPYELDPGWEQGGPEALPPAGGNQENPFVQSTLSEVEDNRTYQPDASTAPLFRRISSKPVRRLRVAPHSLSGVAFSVSASVITCVRRKDRREVLMAKGKGGGAHRPPKRNDKSEVQCG